MKRLLLGLVVIALLLSTVSAFAVTKAKSKTSCARKAKTKCVATAKHKAKSQTSKAKCAATAKTKSATRCGPKAKGAKKAPAAEKPAASETK